MLVAVGLAALGFLIGVSLLVVVPMMRSGQGIFGLLNRGSDAVADARLRLPAGQLAVSTPQDPRPELWQTPVASVVFPSPGQLAELSGAGGVGVTYDPTSRRRPVLSLPPMTDAVGRPIVSGVVALTTDPDVGTPGPLRPDASEPVHLLIMVTPAASTDAPGCILAFAGETLEAIGAVGPAQIEDCQAGVIRLPETGAVAFAVRADKLPNYRSRDGAWREGGVFGRTEVKAALKAAPPD